MVKHLDLDASFSDYSVMDMTYLSAIACETLAEYLLDASN